MLKITLLKNHKSDHGDWLELVGTLDNEPIHVKLEFGKLQIDRITVIANSHPEEINEQFMSIFWEEYQSNYNLAKAVDGLIEVT